MPANLLINIDGQSIDIPCSAVLTIGRDKNSDIVISDPLVSRNHAIIRLFGEDDFYLIDGGSSNGSQINGKRIITATMLSHGDQIEIGSRNIVFSQPNKIGQSSSHSIQQEDTLQVSQFNVRQITVLVSDIRDYTRISEDTPIKTLTKLMSEWSRSVSDDVLKRGGIVEKFIGDAVYARWEAGENATSSIVRALKCAQNIHAISKRLNNTFTDLQHQIITGVGINTGYAAVDIGKDSIALGDTVNTAFRLESASKDLCRDVVLSADSYRCLPEKFWQGKTRTITAKGKKNPIDVCCFSYAEVDERLLSYIKDCD